MENRIRVGVLVFKGNKILLVRHVNPKTGYEWWVPPGGVLEGKETFLECAKRETFEETGLKIKVQQLAYIRQFISLKQNKTTSNCSLQEKLSAEQKQ